MKPTLLTSVVVSVASYAIMELVHHGVIATYVAPWLLSLGMSAAMVTYLCWALVFLGSAAVGWILWKFLVKAED